VGERRNEYGWEPEVAELRRREELARRMGGAERVERQHATGRRTVRERIERLFDPGTFHETGILAGRGTYDNEGELTEFLPANVVVGQGRIDGRRAVLQGDDFTVRGGAADAAIWQKAIYAERMAHDLRLPLVRLVDGTGGGGSVKSLEQMGFTYVPPLPGFDLVVRNHAIVPVTAAALGPSPDSAPSASSRRTSR
jgi:acetyl-CoA carboxylase carboxyltransferase component